MDMGAAGVSPPVADGRLVRRRRLQAGGLLVLALGWFLLWAVLRLTSEPWPPARVNADIPLYPGATALRSGAERSAATTITTVTFATVDEPAAVWRFYETSLGDGRSRWRPVAPTEGPQRSGGAPVTAPDARYWQISLCPSATLRATVRATAPGLTTVELERRVISCWDDGD